MKSFPDFYSACRLWEKERNLWCNYYGSTYDAYQRRQLSVEVARTEYNILFDDKEVCQDLCEAKHIPVPVSYGVIDPREDYRSKLVKIMNENGLPRAIIKPVLGHAGIGVVMAHKKHGEVLIWGSDGCQIPASRFRLGERVIVQEVVVQHPEIRKISSSSVNTIRAVTLLTKGGDFLMLGALMRFSATNSFIDNWSAGGLAVGVNLHGGVLMEYGYDKYGKTFRQHPISLVAFGGFKIPCWDETYALARKVQHSFPYYKMLGLDIAVCLNGPVIIEVNSYPDNILLEQTYGPILKRKEVRKAFEEYNLLLY